MKKRKFLSALLMLPLRTAVSGALAAAAVTGVMTSRSDPMRSPLGFAGGVWMKAPAESELDLVQVTPRRS